MPDPVRLLATLARASRLHRETPGRRGRLLVLNEAKEVFATGDLHGNLENFRRLLKRADLDNYPERHLILQELIHGIFEYPLGGDRSHQLFDVVAALKCQYPTRVHFLPGNHEMAQFTDRRIVKNERDLNLLFHMGVEEAYGNRAREIVAAYRDLFLSLPMAIRTPNRVFLSHSLPSANRLASFDMSMLERDEVPETEWHPGGSLYALAWGRDTGQTNVEGFLQKVDADLLISGHIPCEHGYEVPNDRQVILDSYDMHVGYCLFPADRPLTFQELLEGVDVL